MSHPIGSYPIGGSAPVNLQSANKAGENGLQVSIHVFHEVEKALESRIGGMKLPEPMPAGRLAGSEQPDRLQVSLEQLLSYDNLRKKLEKMDAAPKTDAETIKYIEWNNKYDQETVNLAAAMDPGKREAFMQTRDKSKLSELLRTIEKEQLEDKMAALKEEMREVANQRFKDLRSVGRA